MNDHWSFLSLKTCPWKLNTSRWSTLPADYDGDKKFWICTRVLEVCLSPVFSSVNWIHKVASLGFSNLASIKMSAEACRKQASRLWLQAPEWLQDMNFLAANIWIGRTKYAHISWYPGQKHKFLLPQDSLASELQPVQFSSFGRARFRAQKGAVWC